MQLELYNQVNAPTEAHQRQPLSRFLTQRKVFITIDDATEYKRCRVQSNRKGVVLRDLAKGAAINTKKQQICRPGDFLVAEIDAKVGGYGFVPTELDGAIVSSHYYLFELDEEQLLSRYLYYLVQSDIIQSQISSQGSTNYAAIRPKEFLAIEIPYVEPDEQRAIVARLDALTTESDEFSQEAAHQAALLTRLRQAILREAVQGRLLPQDPTDEPAPALLARIRVEKQRLIKEKKLRAGKPLPPLSESELPHEVPPGWVWCRLGDCIVSAKDGPHFSPQYASKGVPFLSMRNISATGIDFSSAKFISKEYHEEISKRCKPVKGDILYTKGGTTGIACVNDTDIDFNVWVHVAVLRLTPEVYPCYLRDCLNSPFCYTQSQILTKGIGNRDLGLQRMVTIPIPLPPLAEQKRIVAKVAELLAHCTELEDELGRARAAASALHAAALREAFAPVSVMVVAG